ncbi:MAG: MerR family transcriptional regulator [Alphaproteobacteria bacterium]
MAEATERSRRRSGKSSAAFRTISEVAQRLDVPQHVLRFWETKFGQVRPLKRGGGRRYYRPEDIALLERIRSLLYDEGYTIKGVQRLLREGGAKAAVANAVANGEVRDGIDAAEPEARNVVQSPPAAPVVAPPSLAPAKRATLEDLARDLHDLKGLLARIAE